MYKKCKKFLHIWNLSEQAEFLQFLSLNLCGFYSGFQVIISYLKMPLSSSCFPLKVTGECLIISHKKCSPKYWCLQLCPLLTTPWKYRLYRTIWNRYCLSYWWKYNAGMNLKTTTEVVKVFIQKRSYTWSCLTTTTTSKLWRLILGTWNILVEIMSYNVKPSCF